MKAYFYMGAVDGKAKPFFHLERPSHADVNAIPFVFDGPAEEAHKAQFKSEWRQFEKSLQPEPVEVKSEAPKKAKKSEAPKEDQQDQA